MRLRAFCWRCIWWWPEGKAGNGNRFGAQCKTMSLKNTSPEVHTFILPGHRCESPLIFFPFAARMCLTGTPLQSVAIISERPAALQPRRSLLPLPMEKLMFMPPSRLVWKSTNLLLGSPSSSTHTGHFLRRWQSSGQPADSGLT